MPGRSTGAIAIALERDIHPVGVRPSKIRDSDVQNLRSRDGIRHNPLDGTSTRIQQVRELVPLAGGDLHARVDVGAILVLVD